MPVVLMAFQLYVSPTFWGRDDLVRFMARVPLNRVPWRRYTVH
jgi:hypothetical protein